MRTYSINGYSFEVVEKSGIWEFTVFHANGSFCDDGSSRTQNGAERKARKLIKHYASF